MYAALWLVAGVAGVARVAGSEVLAALPGPLLDNLEDLVKAASAACDILPPEVVSVARAAMPAPRLDVVEFTRDGRRSYRATAAHRYVRARGPLVLYVPGWWNSPSDEAARALVGALLRHHEAVLVLDTRAVFGRGYLSAAAAVESVARALYRLVRRLRAAGVRPADLHVLGFSLGAHVAGTAGRMVRAGLRAELGRITALDPARPCFTRSERRLRRGDAAFVQVVHSSAGVLGLAEPLGHADLYVNGVAGRQPECAGRAAAVECDHNAAWRLYAASVSRALPARRCRDWAELEAGRCSGDRETLGYQCSIAARGIYLYKSHD